MIEPNAPAVVGRHLLQIRRERGLTRADAAAVLECDISKISRLERGLTRATNLRPYLQDIGRLLRLYEVNDEPVRGYILGLRQGHTPLGWWDTQPDLPIWVRAQLAWEAAAQQIRTYQPQAIPALLQTEDYAQALARNTLGPGAPQERVDGQVELIRRRQPLLRPPDPPHYWAVLDEVALLTPIGDIGTRVQQLDDLISAAKRPQVHLQINRVFRVTTRYRPRAGAFTLLRHPEEDVPDTLYLHELVEDVASRDRITVDPYRHAWEQLTLNAAGAEDSVDLLIALRDHLATHDNEPPVPPP